MQLFKTLPFLGLLVGTALSLKSDEVVADINIVTDKSQDLQEPVQNLSPFNVITSAPKIISGLRDIVNDLNTDVSNWRNAQIGCDRPRVHQPYRTKAGSGPPWDDAPSAQLICDAFHEFVGTHQALLALLISRRTVFSNTPVLAPMTATLQSLESIVDTAAFNVIDFVPYCASAASADRKTIDKALSDTVKVYQQPALSTEKMSHPQRIEREHGGLDSAAEQVLINIELV